MSSTGSERGARVIDGVVYDARAEAARLLAGARAEAAAIREAARQQGRDEACAEVAALLARARREADRRVQAAEPELRALAVAIAERIVARELALDPDAVVGIARAALGRARGCHELVLRAHPDDLTALDAARHDLLAELSVVAHLRVCADASVARGGCLVDSEVGTVDARLETQLAALARALEEVA